MSRVQQIKKSVVLNVLFQNNYKQIANVLSSVLYVKTIGSRKRSTRQKQTNEYFANTVSYSKHFILFLTLFVLFFSCCCFPFHLNSCRHISEMKFQCNLMILFIVLCARQLEIMDESVHSSLHSGNFASRIIQHGKRAGGKIFHLQVHSTYWFREIPLNHPVDISATDKRIQHSIQIFVI